MWILFRKESVYVVICLMSCFYVTVGLYIDTGYEGYGRNKRDHTALCVQEPYYMCKNPEFLSRQPSVPSRHYDKLHYQQGLEASGLVRNSEENDVNFHHQAMQYENIYQQTPLLSQPDNRNIGSYHDSIQPQMPLQMYHYSPSAGNSEHHLAAYPTPNYSDIPPVKLTYLPGTEITNGYGSKAVVEEKINDNDGNNNVQQFTTEALAHDTNPEQFKALLKDEVLGTPNLAFSNDEMIPIQKTMYSESPAETSLTSQGPYIPYEYLDDPILRTFYNIDHNPAGYNIEKTSFPARGIDACSQLMSPNDLPLTIPSGSNILSKGCDCPLTFQPIFVAIPWFTSFYNDVLSNIESTSWLKQSSKGATEQYNLNKGYSGFDNSYLSQSRINNDTISREDLPTKNSQFVSQIKTNSSQPQTNPTQAPESSEEDLFVEDITITADTVNKQFEKSNEDPEYDENDTTKASTSILPHTTARAFETMLYAAKKHSKAANAERNSPNPIQSVLNKRHIEHVDSAPYPSNFKKHYVRKLENHDN